MKKGVLFLTALFAATAAKATNIEIHYVDGAGNKPGTYATIEQAVDAAKPGDVIEVAAGTYSVNPPLNINKNNITLRNKEGHRPILQPNPNPKYTEATTHKQTPDQKIGYKSFDALISINAHDITLKGFEIKNPHNISSLHGVVVTNSTNTVITDNIITGFQTGLYIEYSHYPEVQKNTLTENSIGAYVSNSRNIAIYQNNIFNNDVHNLAYSNNQNINATCNWWGSTDIGVIAGQIKNIEETIGDQATWIPVSLAKNLPCLYKMFRLEIIVKEQNQK